MVLVAESECFIDEYSDRLYADVRVFVPACLVGAALAAGTKAKEEDLTGLKRGSCCLAVPLNSVHCVQVWSLPVSTLRVCGFGGVPMSSVTVYPSPLI